MQLQFTYYGGYCCPSRTGHSCSRDLFPRLSASLRGSGSHHVHFLDLKEDADGGLIPALGLFPFPIQNAESERAFIRELL